MSTNAKILDFSCGIGNHSIPLANNGYKIVGYDPSATYLAIAQQNASSLIANRRNIPKFIRGDPYNAADTLAENNETDFDAIIIMDNSFGYSDKACDVIMLENLLKVAKSKCILILEVENRDWRLLNFEPITHFESEKLQVYGEWKFDFRTSVSRGLMHFYERNSRDDPNLRLSLKFRMLMRLYSLHELLN